MARQNVVTLSIPYSMMTDERRHALEASGLILPADSTLNQISMYLSFQIDGGRTLRKVEGTLIQRKRNYYRDSFQGTIADITAWAQEVATELGATDVNDVTFSDDEVWQQWNDAPTPVIEATAWVPVTAEQLKMAQALQADVQAYEAEQAQARVLELERQLEQARQSL